MSLYLSGTESLDHYLEHIHSAKAIAFDMESYPIRYKKTHLPTGRYRLLGVGLGTGEMAAYATKSDFPLAMEWLKSLHCTKIAHSATADLKELHGLGPDGYTVHPDFSPIYDTMVAGHLLEYFPLNLQYLVSVVLERDIDKYEDILARFSAEDLKGVPELEVARYNLSQVRATHDLYSNFTPRMKDLGLSRAFRLEMKMLPILAGMEEVGFMVDREKLTELGTQFRELGDALQEAVADLTNGHVKKVLGPQVGKYLFGKEEGQLGQKVIYRSRQTGTPTCDERVLEKFAVREGFEWVRIVLKARQIRKLPKTYCDGVISGLDKANRSHTELSQVTAETGRLASKNPNHQNIPKRRAEGLSIRRCFISRPGYTLISCDKDQVELRCLAEESGEVNMKEAFLTGRDIHMQTTMDIFGDPKMRYAGKVLNYTIAYLSGAQQIADQSKVTKGRAELWQRKYFRKYHHIKTWVRIWGDLCEEQGYVQTPLGRRRDLSRFYGKNKMEGVRKAVNTRVQGGAAEVIKLDTVRLILGGKSMAMEDVEQRTGRVVDGLAHAIEQGLDAKLILQVHDEVIIEVRDDQVDWACRITKDALTSSYGTMPLPCTVKIGKNWADVHPWVDSEVHA